MKVYKVYKWFRDWSYNTKEVRFTKFYLKHQGGSTVFASEKGAKAAIANQGKYYPNNKNGYRIEEYECTKVGEIKDKYSHQGCLCDDCPFVQQTDPEEFVCGKDGHILYFTMDYWEANCPLKIEDK